MAAAGVKTFLVVGESRVYFVAWGLQCVSEKGGTGKYETGGWGLHLAPIWRTGVPGDWVGVGGHSAPHRIVPACHSLHCADLRGPRLRDYPCMETQDSTGWFRPEFAAQGIPRRGWRIIAVRCPVPNSAEPSSRKRLSQMLTHTSLPGKKLCSAATRTVRQK